MEIKKLYRSKQDRMIAGVCGGLGEYFSVDSTVIRVGLIFITVSTGILPGILSYIIATTIIPSR